MRNRDLAGGGNCGRSVAGGAARRGISWACRAEQRVVLNEADQAPAASAAVVLSPEESRCFLDGLDKLFQPNARLKKAMEEAEGLLKPLRR